MNCGLFFEQLSAVKVESISAGDLRNNNIVFNIYMQRMISVESKCFTVRMDGFQHNVRIGGCQCVRVDMNVCESFDFSFQPFKTFLDLFLCSFFFFSAQAVLQCPQNDMFYHSFNLLITVLFYTILPANCIEA